MRLRRARKGKTLLNVTPLIDVVFILLVFFMLATHFGDFKLIDMRTPPETEAVRDPAAAIVVLLTTDGARFDGEPLGDATLTAKTAEILAIDPDRAFIVRPEEGVEFQAAVDAFSTVKKAGAKAISFSRPRAEGAAQ